MVCKPGELGEICIGSPCTMKEYLERPDETKECFLDDGFIRTGDLGFYTEKGEFFLVDRIKEIIKYIYCFAITRIIFDKITKYVSHNKT